MVSLLFDRHEKTPSGYRYAPVAVVCRETSARNTRLVSLALWATPFEKTILNRFFFTDPTSNARRSHNPSCQIQFSLCSKKRTHHPKDSVFSYGCGGRIWTYNLRVMSPTSYRVAPLRDIYGAADRTWTGTIFLSKDFKSFVSADSTTAAGVTRRALLSCHNRIPYFKLNVNLFYKKSG